MTIGFTVPRSTNNLVYEKRPRFVPTRIPAPHHQLKHYLSTRCGDYIYYATTYDIYAVHLPSNNRRLVKSLKWKPFCLDAAYNWICVGGQSKGQCAFIEIRREPDDPTLPSYQPAEVDDLLNLNLDSHSRAILTQSSRHSPHRFPRFVCHEHEIGADIVNSVVIHRLAGGHESLQDEVVVILTNNDRTVSVFSLSRQEMLDCPSEYPTPMNHASISPDGNLLLAVGDVPKVFFHRRVFWETTRKGKPVWSWTWREVCAPTFSLDNTEDCYFSTGFSPSGHICAAASQSGVVTLFNTGWVKDDMEVEDAVIGVVRSSRSNVSTYRGAFRSMSFSPAPWDLLVLAEDQGRVMIIDLRNAMQSMQTLVLQTQSRDIEPIGLEDQDSPFLQRQLDVERRFLESHEEAQSARDHLAAVINTADYMEYSAESRRRERDAMNLQFENLRSNIRGDPHRLTDSERQLLDVVRARRSNENSLDPPTPTSMNHPSGSNRFLPFLTPWDSSSPASTSPLPRTTSIAEYMRQRSDRPRTSGDRFHHPRRRSSVVVSQSANPNTSSSSNTLAPITTRSSNLSASPSRLQSTTSPAHGNLDALDEPWQTISNAMGSSSNLPAQLRRPDSNTLGMRDRDPRTQSSEPENVDQAMQIQTLRQLEARNDHQREINQLNAQRLSILRAQPRRVSDDEDNNVDSFAGRYDPADGVVTMGVGWSTDGRELFVATEDGILQYQVNTIQRCQIAGSTWI